MPTFTRRDRLTIFAQILKTTKNSQKGKKKADIMQSINLNYHQANKYLHLLVTNGLLQQDSNDRYKTTKKGTELISTLETMNLEFKQHL